MKKSFGLFVMVGLLLAFGGCMRSDDEPVIPTRPISRLYVSFESYNAGQVGDPIANIAVIDRADTSAAEIDTSYNYDSGAIGGQGIHFNPFAGLVFQAGKGDTTIHALTVGTLGQLGSAATIGNGMLTQMRGLAYHPSSNMLYVANNVSPTRIFGFLRPQNSNGYEVPDKDLRLGSAVRPWGVMLWNDSLLVSNSGTDGGVLLYGDVTQTDSLEADFQPISTVRIAGASSIRGFAFVDSLDVMVLADFGTEGSLGKVYIVEGIKEYLKQPNVTVTPTRVITGMSTGLTGPIDVAIDPRATKRTIYVADQSARTVSRFKLSDEGNIAPEATIFFDNRVPFSISLDARGVVQ
ncbi:hypothetical protein [Parapedobacter sp. DT-150]|uniref:hypothetical protein n=1 Tax=Parapedobacter sp. DT-150 TaxID=3396162 RepID=UPI003F1D3BDB